MRSYLLLPAFGLLAAAAPAPAPAPVPQGIVWDVVDAAPDVTLTPVDPLAAPALVPADTTGDVNAVKNALLSDINDPAPLTPPSNRRRAVSNPTTCKQWVGHGPTIDVDDVSHFQSSSLLSGPALGAAPPAGWTQVFQNKLGQSQTTLDPPLGFNLLDTYNPGDCAAYCDSTTGCVAFNILFERYPSYTPQDGVLSDETCTDVPSVTRIKCVALGEPIAPESPLYAGGVSVNGVAVVYAGSNGYVRTAARDSAGYSQTSLGNFAINAPLDCNGDDTFMGSKIFTNVPFNPDLCATACDAQSQYNLRHPVAGKPTKTCQFFNTYVLLKNGISTGQYCALYTKSWLPSYATNAGQYRGADKYTVIYSYSFTNTTYAGAPRAPCLKQGCYNIKGLQSQKYLTANPDKNVVINGALGNSAVWYLSGDVSSLNTSPSPIRLRSVRSTGPALDGTGYFSYLTVKSTDADSNAWYIKLRDPNYPNNWYISNKGTPNHVADVAYEYTSDNSGLILYPYKTGPVTDNQHWAFTQINCPA